MATTFIPISTSARLGAQARRAVDLLREVRDDFDKLKAVLDTQVDGADYTMVESQFGLQSGQGQTFYNLMAGAFAAIDVSAIQQLINRAG